MYKYRVVDVCMYYRDEFVRGNALFYTVMFQDMLTRFNRIDLTASKMAFQLSRVCKVFNQPGLIDVLRQGKNRNVASYGTLMISYIHCT